MSSSTACSLCGAVGPVHAHHITGRAAPGGAYFDDALVIDVCPRCHTAAGGLHPLLRTLGAEFAQPGGDVLAHRLRRVAVHAELIGEGGRPLVLAPKSARGLAALLREAAVAVDAVLIREAWHDPR